MRAKSGQAQDFFFSWAVDEEQVRLDVALTVSTPVTAQIVVAMSWLKWKIIGERGQDRHEVVVERHSVLTSALPLVVALECG
jgi:hypothetical protein